MPKEARKYLDFMGAYWSCSPDAFHKIETRFELDGVIDFQGLDVVQLVRKPRGEITKFRNDLRMEN